MRGRQVDDIVRPGRQGQVDLLVEHHCTGSGEGESASQRPLTHWQALTSLKPQTLAMPLAAHCARTPCGSVGLLRLTQAGIAPQQLPTSFTAQSALVLQA